MNLQGCFVRNQFQVPDAPPPSYNSLYNSAVAFPKTIKQTLINNIRGNSTAPENVGQDENELDEARENGEVKNNGGNVNDEEEATCCDIMCVGGG